MIGLRLTSLRRMRGLSQIALARKVGTSQTQVSRVEKGERYPSLRYVLRVCRALRTPPNDVLFDEMFDVDMPLEDSSPVTTGDRPPKALLHPAFHI